MKKGHLITAIIAVLLFTWVVAHMSLASMQQLKAMRIALPIVLVLSTLRFYLQSLTWSASLKGQGVSADNWPQFGSPHRRWDISPSSAQSSRSQ